jgi:hypothetical protein
MSTLGKSPQFGIYQRMDAITGTGDSSYTLKIDTVPQPNFIAEQLIVSVNGVIQAPNSAYTVSGSTITFTEGLDSADHIIDFITAMGHAHSTNTVSDNSVTAAKLNDALAITNTPVRKNTNRIQTGFTLDSNDNAVVGGPITIDSGVSVVINGSLSIV